MHDSTHHTWCGSLTFGTILCRYVLLARRLCDRLHLLLLASSEHKRKFPSRKHCRIFLWKNQTSCLPWSFVLHYHLRDSVSSVLVMIIGNKVTVVCVCVRACACMMMMTIAFITYNSSLVPLIEVLCSSNPCECEFSVLNRIELTIKRLIVPYSDQLSHACTWGHHMCVCVRAYVYVCVSLSWCSGFQTM